MHLPALQFKPSRRFFYPLIIGLLLWVQPLFAQSQPPTKVFAVVKSEQDIRSYRYIVLGNQLRVLLVSDSRAEKSAAALNVNAGHYQNPVQLPGLAHLFEHMLMVSAEKYPQPGDYQRFIQERGGSVGSATGEQNSQYYFAIANSHLDLALDRFAQFFIAPLFDANAIEREKNVINGERLAQLNDEGQRQRHVYRQLLNPEHPAARAADGDLTLLADADGHQLRDQLFEFYKSHYSANLMSLVVIGNHKLDDLQKMVESHFASIGNSNLTLATKPPLFAAGALPASVAMQSATGQRLALVFPVASYLDRYSAKPWDYVTHLLINEAPGSLAHLLKSLGWIESLDVEHLLPSGQEELLQISLRLTPEGAKAKEQIVSAAFEYFKILSQRGVSDWRFDELKQMAELDFRFPENPAAISGPLELLQAMQVYAAKDLLRGKYDYSLFDEVLIKKALAYLRRDNVLIVDTDPAITASEGATADQVPYKLTAGIAEPMELKSAYRQKLALPERNIFIPKNISVKAPSMKFGEGDASTHPGLLLNHNQFILWFLQDQYYRVPRSEINFQVLLPSLNNSLENAARVQLFVALAMDQLQDYADLAAKAGSHFTIKAHSRGFDVYLAGYSDRQSLLLDKIVSALAQADFAEPRFDAIKKQLLQDWRNQDRAVPEVLLPEKIAQLQYQPSWESADYAGALQNLSFDKFKRFSAEVLPGAKIQALFYGNLYAQDAIKLAGLIDYQLLKRKVSYPMRGSKVLRTENKNGKSWLYPYPAVQQALALYIPATSPTINSSAHMLLLNQVLQPLFYRQLRDENPLGDYVSMQLLPLKNLQASLFLVKSPQGDQEQIAAGIDRFLTTASSSLTENFADNKNALLAQLRRVPINLAGQAEQFWQSILLNDQSFSRQQEMFLAASKITPESLQAYYKNTFLQENRRLWLSGDKFKQDEGFELIENLGKYRQEQASYLFP
ncbi:MAG TPA: insulinase family protein [Cellvibrio sp.]|nr:insulinase family protein [Cellvibrio sp.]